MESVEREIDVNLWVSGPVGSFVEERMADPLDDVVYEPVMRQVRWELYDLMGEPVWNL